VKTTIIVRDAADLPEIAAARAGVLGDRRPASTLFIGLLVNPAWKVEIEAIACA
jgi:2-iminobutanoate/2-iminopropanoate deaminase